MGNSLATHFSQTNSSSAWGTPRKARVYLPVRSFDSVHSPQEDRQRKRTNDYFGVTQFILKISEEPFALGSAF